MDCRRRTASFLSACVVLCVISTLVFALTALDLSKSFVRMPWPWSKLKPAFDPDPRLAQLREFLDIQKSPLAQHAEYLLRKSDQTGIDYRLVLGIARAESSFGRSFQGCVSSYNLWGIKGEPAEPCNPYLKRFESQMEGIDSIYQVLVRYRDDGKGTPEKMVGRYVGRNHPGWVSLVKTTIRTITPSNL